MLKHRTAATRTSAILAVLGVINVLGARPRDATAKEGAGGCPTLLRLVDQTQTLMVVAADLRTKGSALAAYQTLRTTMEQMTARARDGQCGALADMLDAALARARVAPSAVRATLTLDLGLAALLSLTLAGTVLADDLGAKEINMGESAHHGDGCPDLFRLAQRLDRGRADARAASAGVLSDLRARPRCASLTRVLAAAPPDQAQLAVDTILLDQAPESAAPTDLFARCPEYPLITDRLRTAITMGAPLFNRGDHAGCRALYEKTAREAVTLEVLPRGRCPAVRLSLQNGLDEAGRAGNAEAAAWSLRRAFDRVLGVQESPKTPPGDGANPVKQVEFRPFSPPSTFFSRPGPLRP